MPISKDISSSHAASVGDVISNMNELLSRAQSLEDASFRLAHGLLPEAEVARA